MKTKPTKMTHAERRERAADIVRRFRGGELTESLIKDSGLSRSQVLHILREAGCRLKGHFRGKSAAPKTRPDYCIFFEFQASEVELNLSEIGRKYGVSRQYVWILWQQFLASREKAEQGGAK